MDIIAELQAQQIESDRIHGGSASIESASEAYRDAQDSDIIDMDNYGSEVTFDTHDDEIDPLFDMMLDDDDNTFPEHI